MINLLSVMSESFLLLAEPYEVIGGIYGIDFSNPIAVVRLYVSIFLSFF